MAGALAVVVDVVGFADVPVCAASVPARANIATAVAPATNALKELNGEKDLRSCTLTPKM